MQGCDGGAGGENTHPASAAPFLYLSYMSTFSFASFLDAPKMVYRLRWLVALPVHCYERIEITVSEELHVERICWWV